MGDKVLTLSTLEPDRPKVSIDNAEFEMAIIGDFGIRDLARLQRLAKKIAGIREHIGDATETEIEELERDLDQFVKTVIRKLPEDVFAKLNFPAKMAVMEAFSKALPEAKAGGAKKQTGDPSAQGSSASTEATQSDGGTSPSA
jgi:hypothetical protein